MRFIFWAILLMALPALADNGLSLSGQALPVKPLLQTIAKALHKNMVITGDVEGEVSLNLHNVPWDQALQLLVKTQNLVAEQLPKAIIVMPEADYAKQKQKALQLQKNVTALAPLQSVLVHLHFASAAKLSQLFKAKGHRFLSVRGSITFDARTNTLLIEDVASKLISLRKVIKQLDVPIRQVLIKARIVNADRDYEREIGARLGVSKPRHLSGTLEGANDLAKGIPAAQVPLTQRLNFDMPSTVLFDNPGRVGLAVAKLGHGILVDMELSAMEKQHMLKIVASPRLIASHSETALIEAGTEIPYEQQSEGGATSATFKKAVMKLQVKPQITRNNHIILTLEVNHDKPGEITSKGLSIKTQRIHTQVLLKNNQTVVVGGIYETQQQNTVDRVPILGDLPLIGYLFSHRMTVEDHRELLIFITPEILKQGAV